MPRLSPPGLFLVLALLAGSACSERPSTAEPAGEGAPSAEAESTPEADNLDGAPQPEGPSSPPTVFDAADAVFDTLEPPSRPRVEIQTPTMPRPRPLPVPEPIPPPKPDPLPPPSPAPPVAGSCDVRGTESYCFTYTGAAWSSASAEEHCAAAPEAAYRAAECPAEGRIGTCVFRRGETPSREIIYTYYEPYDLGLARLACPGRFTAE